MPELPEVETYKRHFDETSLDKTIRDIEVRRDNVLKTPENQLRSVLPGQRFITSKRIGKFMGAKLSNGQWIMLHFGMTGHLKYYDDEADAPDYPRVIFHFEDDGKLAFDNMRLFGEVELIENLDEYLEGRGIGQDALDMSWDDFKAALDGRRGMLKTTLMNQSIISGIGNIWADEILLQCKLHPETKVNQLTDDQLRELYDTMQNAFKTGLDVDAIYSNLPDHFLLRNREEGAPCPNDCDGELASMKVSGRTTIYCPSCQTKPK